MPQPRATTALVLGATGFLGANVTRQLLRAGAEVHVLSRRTRLVARLEAVRTEIEFHEGDLRDRDGLSRIVTAVAPDVIYHLAATSGRPSERRPEDLFEDNVLGAHNLLAATAGLPDCRIVYTASSLELARSHEPLSETSPIEPVGAFGAHKAAATLLLRSAAVDEGRSITLLRPFAIYGPWEPRRRLIPTAIIAALTGTPLSLTPPGFVRDYVHVDDVARACLMAAARDDLGGETFHIASGHETANEAIIALIEAIVGVEIERRVGDYAPHATDTRHWHADIRKAERALGWKPRISLEDGLRRTVDWIKEQDLESLP